MAIVQHRPNRKYSGGRYHAYRKKRVFEAGSLATRTTVGETKKQKVRAKFGIVKNKLLSANVANVILKDGKCKLAKIKTVTNNPANQNYTRRNIMTRGAIIDTELGKAVVTSRPGQTGTLNAKLL